MTHWITLHSHSSASSLDGHPLPAEHAAYCAQLGMTAAALTDHGTMAGIPEFVAACKAHQITPIVGMEAYCVQSCAKPARDAPHLTLLAMNAAGYRNLCKLSTFGQLDGFYAKPKIDWRMLEAHHEGLIVLSGCGNSELAKAILAGDEEMVEQTVDFYHSLFGERYFLEFQEHHDDFKEQRIINARQEQLGQKHGIPGVATTDSHFCAAGDILGKKALVGIRARRELGKEPFAGSPWNYIRPHAEMAPLFRPDYLSATNEIASWVETYPLGHASPRLPVSPLEREGISPYQTALAIVRKGVERHLGCAWRDVPQRYVERLQMELGVVETLSAQLGADFFRYLLLVTDLCDFARRARIRFGPRGSAAGSLLCWGLGISEPDPIKDNLYFERFLNPFRVELPDIDLDFADDRRGEIFAYLAQTYGQENVARIAAYATYGAKGALIAVAPYLSCHRWQGEELARLIPDDPRPGGMPLEEALEVPAGKALQEKIAQDPEARKIADYALKITGRVSATSTHPAGVVVANCPIGEVAPLMRVNKNEDEIPHQTQYEMDQLEKLGLLKVDVLGLKTLATFDHCLRLVEESTGIAIDPWTIPLDDEKSWEIIHDGHVLGLFQIGSAGLSRAVKELKPDSINDLALTVAVYRPGPMANLSLIAGRKHGRAAIEPVHASIDALLVETYGVPVYQEQIMEIVRHFAGFSLGEADLMRKAIGKKKKALLDEQESLFRSGAGTLGRSEEEIQTIWDFIVPFAAYGFNRAHAVCYAYLAYQSAYLKAHFPEEFYAAAMAVEGRGGSIDSATPQVRIGSLVREAKLRGIAVLPPDVSQPSVEFAPAGDGAIRYGLSSVKNLSRAAAEEIARGQPYAGFVDFLIRCPSVKKNELIALIECGAVPWGPRQTYLVPELPDPKKPKRGELGMAASPLLEQLLQNRATLRRSQRPGQQALGLRVPTIDAFPYAEREYDVATLLSWEQNALGLFRSPLPAIPGIAFYPDQIADLGQCIDEPVQISGVITSVKEHIVRKSGKVMGYATIMDETGAWNLTIFSRNWEVCKATLKVGKLVIVNGACKHDRDEPTIFVDVISGLPELDPIPVGAETLRLGDDPLEALAALRRLKPGGREVTIRFRGEEERFWVA